jgi:hypothetical protein
MSAPISAGVDFGQLIGDALSGFALSTTGERSIGDFTPHVVVEETHTDTLMITQHPVETGAAVTDHSFLLPPTVAIHCGWSNSTAGTDGFVQAVYSALLALQQSRTPFSISTGKRSYSNMLIATFLVRTTEDSEYSLDAVVTAQFLNMVSTQTTSAAGTTSATGGGAGSLSDGSAQFNLPAGQTNSDYTISKSGTGDSPNPYSIGPIPQGDVLPTPQAGAASFGQLQNTLGAIGVQ